MSGFGAHFRGAVAVGVAGCIAVYIMALQSGIAMQNAVGLGGGAFALAVIAGTLPDVDVHSSIIRRLFGRAGLVLVVAAVLGYIWVRPSVLDPLVAALASLVPDLPSPRAIGTGVAVALAVVAASTVGSLFDSITTHRGWFHSPLLGLGLGAATAGGLYHHGYRSPRLLATVGGVVTAAFFTHLLLDR